jgi:hypothetical protein
MTELSGIRKEKVVDLKKSERQERGKTSSEKRRRKTMASLSLSLSLSLPLSFRGEIVC